MDKWLADQLAELKKENHWLTDQVVDKLRSLRSRVGSIGMGQTDKQTKPLQMS